MPESRPQQARSLATRRRLLDAAVDSLLELGFSRASTPEVCQRAGVSQGALFKHFRSKAALLAATVEHLFESLIEDFRRAFDAIAAEEDRIEAAVRLLWAVFRQPRLEVALELFVASRTDPELHDALAPVLARHRENLHEYARALFPEAAERGPAFIAMVDTVLDAMQGAAVGALVLPDPEAKARQGAWLVDLARRELAASASA